MSHPPSLPRRRLPAFAFALLLLAGAVATTWWARGRFDELFLYEGHLHLVNRSPDSIQVELEFPSGQRVTAELPGNGFEDFSIARTGEGSIGVTVNGTALEPVGYVTSHNPPMIVVVDEDRAGFSQWFGSRATRVP